MKAKVRFMYYTEEADGWCIYYMYYGRGIKSVIRTNGGVFKCLVIYR